MANEFIIKNGFFSQGSSNITGSLTVSQGITGSLFGTASYTSTALSSSYALTASYLNTLNQDLTFNGNLTLNGTASIAYLNVVYETASVIYSSGSNQFGDSTSDTQTLIGTVKVSGSLQVTGSILATQSYISQVDYIDFDTGSATPAWKSGRVFWNDIDGALSVYNSEAEVTLQVGQENWTRIRNNTGTTITNGTVVRIIGAQGDAPTVERAQSIAKSGSINVDTQILGVATHDIEDSSFGYVTTQGLVRGLDTNAFADGETLFVGTGSAGILQNTAPVAPYEIIPVGVCVKAGPGGSGIIYVAVQQPLDFSDLSTVFVQGAYSIGDLWVYKNVDGSSVWTHTNQLTGSYVITGSLNVTEGIEVSGGITGSLFGTASWAENVLSSSYALTSSYVENAQTASYTDPLFISASAAAAGFGPVITAGGVNGQIQYNNNSAFSGVSVLTYDGSILRGTGSFSGSFSGYLEGTASYANLANSASYVESASYSLTSNLSNNTILFNGSDKNVFATTGSNSFTGEQTINGSLTITQNLTVLGSSSIQYITSSQLVISDNIISVNTFSPSLRFGGLAVIDSGSVSNASGSLLFDSQNNQWIFVHQSEGSSAVTSSVLIMGPQTFDNVGNETTITSNRVTKGTGGDLGEHIGDSNITDTGTVVSINSATEITGSVVITAGVTGSSFNISNAPTLNNTNTQILTRNSTTGQIEYSNQSSAYIFNYGLAHAISNFNYLI